MEGDNKTFKVSFTTDGVVRLRDRVKERLKEFMGDYTDDTLVEYVIVLLRNGRSKEEARNELNVFLGDDDSDSFVAWLWNHLSLNLNLYVQSQEAQSNGMNKPKPVVGRQQKVSKDNRLNTESGKEQSNSTSRSRRNREWTGFMKAAGEPPPFKTSELSIILAGEKNLCRVDRAERSISPRASGHRKRSRHDDRKQEKRDGPPLVPVHASSRLLQFAVREAVGTAMPASTVEQPKLKRLRSVVSTLTGNPSLDEHPQRIRPVARLSNATAVAIKAVAEAAEDVVRVRSSGNVFDRLGRGVDFSESSHQLAGFTDTSVQGEEYGDFNKFHVEEDPDFYKKRKHNGNVALTESQMGLSSNFALENEGFDDVNIVGHEVMDISQSVPVKGSKEVDPLLVPYNVARNSDYVMQKSQNRDPAHSTDLANAPYVDRRFVPEANTGTGRHGGHLMKENSKPVTVGSGDNVSVSDWQNKSQKTASAPGLLSNIRPMEDADSRTIFVNNVHFAATKDSLSRHFNNFGEVLKVVILTDAATGQPKGSAYVEFMRREAAENALSLDGASFMSRVIKVCFKSAAHQEGVPVTTWPRILRAPSFASPRFSRAPFPRGITGSYRARPPRKLGARSMQWKRVTQVTTVDGAISLSGNSFPPRAAARSLTYVRTEPKVDGNSATT